MRRLLRKLLLLALAGLVLLGGWMVYFARMPINVADVSHELVLERGTSLRAIARQLVREELLAEPWSFILLVEVHGMAARIQAGNYELHPGMRVYDLFQMLTQGSRAQRSVTFIEGWTFRQMRAALDSHPDVHHLTTSLSERDIMQQLAGGDVPAEGLFFPDTYYFDRGMSDLEILQRAHATMQRKLERAWRERAPGLPYRSPYEALIMASIIEKETGRGDERPMIASVFVNRLKLGMRLQTDPTVIYGMGSRFDGNLRRQDLLTDTPHNTYTRHGLPPTPIAMPGEASLKAALHPAASRALYFVGKGDGSHAFSATLDEHNRAVRRYQLNR